MKLQFFVASILLVLLMSGCLNYSSQNGDTQGIEPGGEETGLQDFEVHEWGVIVGCSESNESFVTNRPKELLFVRQPVIYIHSKGKLTFDAKVEFSNGTVTETWPETEMNGKIVEWKNVNVVEGPPLGGHTRGIEETLIPLEEILPILRNTDANFLSYNSQTEPFLYYEGKIDFENKVSATYNFETKEAVIKNENNFPVYNVIVAASRGDFINQENFYSFAEKIEANQEIKIEFMPRELETAFENDFLQLGFTGKETNAFTNLWRKPFLSPTNMGFAHLIYRIPQAEYDKLISLEVTPPPKKTIRALYILTDLLK